MSTATPIRTKRRRWSPSDGKASKATISISKKPSTKAPAAESASEPIAEPGDMGNKGGAEASAPLGTESAAAAPAAAASGAGAAAGAAGAIGGGLTSRMPTPVRGPGLIEMAPPPEMLFDPQPMAANRFTVGNASRGNINLGGLWGGAKPNPAYNPALGPAPGNMPYQGTEGFMGGVKRLFAGNDANERNAAALNQANAMRQWMWQQQAARQLDAGRDMSVNRDAAATDLAFKPQIAGEVAKATGALDQTKANTQATIDDNNRAEMMLPFELDQRAAQTGLTNANTQGVLGNEQRDRGMYDSRLQYEQERVRGLRDATNRGNAALQPELDNLAAQTNLTRSNTQTEDAMRTPRVNLTNAQEAGVKADASLTQARDYSLRNHIQQLGPDMFLEPRSGRVFTSSTPGLPPEFQKKLQNFYNPPIPIKDMGDAPPEFFDQGPPAPAPVPTVSGGGVPQPASDTNLQPLAGGYAYRDPQLSKGTYVSADGLHYAPSGGQMVPTGSMDVSQSDTAAMEKLLPAARQIFLENMMRAKRPHPRYGAPQLRPLN